MRYSANNDKVNNKVFVFNACPRHIKETSKEEKQGHWTSALGSLTLLEMGTLVGCFYVSLHASE